MGLFLAVLLIIPLSLYRAYVVWLGWQWFIAPAFGVTTPDFLMLYGAVQTFVVLSYRASGVADDYTSDKVKQEQGKEGAESWLLAKAFKGLVVTAMYITVAWFILWVVHNVAS